MTFPKTPVCMFNSFISLKQISSPALCFSFHFVPFDLIDVVLFVLFTTQVALCFSYSKYRFNCFALL